MNIHNISIFPFVITAIKSTWFYLRNNSSPLGLYIKRGFPSTGIKKRKRAETRMHSSSH